MKILLLYPHFPDPPNGGTALRNYNLAWLLAARHEVSIVAFGDPNRVKTSTLASQCAHVEVVPPPRRSSLRRLLELAHPRPDLACRLRSPALAAALRRALATARFDILHVGGLEMVPHWLDAAAKPSFGTKGSASPIVVLDEHNAEYVLQLRAFLAAVNARRAIGALYSGLQVVKLRRYERAAIRRADGVVAVSEADGEALRQLGAMRSLAIVPNGVDTEVYHPSQRPKDRATTDESVPWIVFTGTMSFRPNIEGVEWFVRHVWPIVRARLPGARFAIVGREPAAAVRALAKLPGIQVVGAVPDDRPWIGRASVYVAPLLAGGGVRLKILQAMALGVPVVSTTLGYEGIAATAGEHLLAADSPEAFADAVCNVATDAHLRAALGARGRELVVARYDWRQLVPRLEDFYARLRRSRQRPS